MKIKNSNQTTSTSPRFKRRGLIQLALICLLSAFTASIQGFAQGSINEQITRNISLHPYESAVNSVLPEIAAIQTKASTIPTGWDNITVTPSRMSASQGGNILVSGRLICRNKNGSYSTIPNQTVYLVLGDGPKTFKGVTDKNGWVRIKLHCPPTRGLLPPGVSVPLRLTLVYRPNRVFAPSQSSSCFINFSR